VTPDFGVRDQSWGLSTVNNPTKKRPRSENQGPQSFGGN
jgi:hypothetical protein